MRVLYPIWPPHFTISKIGKNPCSALCACLLCLLILVVIFEKLLILSVFPNYLYKQAYRSNVKNRNQFPIGWLKSSHRAFFCLSIFWCTNYYILSVALCMLQSCNDLLPTSWTSDPLLLEHFYYKKRNHHLNRLVPSALLSFAEYSSTNFFLYKISQSSELTPALLND